MTRTEAFVKNVLSTALSQIVTMLAGFVIPRVMLTVYGSEVNGLVTSVTQFISYFSLVEAGIGASTVYSLYSPLADNDTARINSIITASRTFYFKTGYIFLTLIAAGALVYPIFIKTNLLSNLEVGALFFILGFNSVIDFFALAKYRSLLTASQKTYVISLANIASTVLNCLVIVVFSYLGFSIVVVRLIALFAIVVRSLILWVYCRKKFSYIRFDVEPDNTALNKRWDALYLQILGAIHSGAPTIIATFILSLEQVSIYSIFNIVVAGIGSILGIFTSGLSAGFGDLISRSDDVVFERAFRQFEYVYYMLIAIVYSITFVMYMPFIRLYTNGADISYNYPLLAVLMAINGYFYNLKTPYGMLVISEGMYKETRWATTLQGLIEVGASVVLAFPFGIYGIVIGVLLSNLYRDVQFLFYAEGHLIPFKIRKTLELQARSVILFFAVSFALLKLPFVDLAISVSSWIIKAVFVSIISCAVIVGINILFDRKLFKQTLSRFTSLLSRG